MIKLRFYQRIALWLVVVFMLLLMVFFHANNQIQHLVRSEAQQTLHLRLAEQLANDTPQLSKGEYDEETLKNLFHTLMVLGPNFEFYFLDPTGMILAYAADANKIKRSHVDITPLKHVIEHTAALPVFGDDPRNDHARKIFSAAPIYLDSQLKGFLYIILAGEIYDSTLEALSTSHSTRIFFAFVVASFIFLLIALLVLFRFLTRPLNSLVADIEKFRNADFNDPLASISKDKWCRESQDEIHRLGCAFTDMLQYINIQFSQLQQIDSQRRILLADLSHDLRTPLASLQGYIETLVINEEQYTPTERKYFLNVCLKNANNLKHLIDQIFELAYLEGGQVTLNYESFPLGELLHDVIAKFSLKAKEKRLAMSITPHHFNYHVFADIGKLERVLTNLIDNAIRHTPHDGFIEIIVVFENNKVRLEIRDSGIGISEQEVALIFDARYQASNSVKDKRFNAGLGLAISQKLVSLFDTELKVESKLGKGTCFSFELLLAEGLEQF